MLWLKDGKLVTKDGKLVECDNCPCSTMDIRLNVVMGTHIEPDGSETSVTGSVFVSIQSASKRYSATQYGSKDVMGVAFYNVPSDYPITGELIVSFYNSCNGGGISGFYGNHEGSSGVGPEDPNDRRNLFTGFKCTFEITKDTPIWYWPLQQVEVYRVEDNS